MTSTPLGRLLGTLLLALAGSACSGVNSSAPGDAGPASAPAPAPVSAPAVVAAPATPAPNAAPAGDLMQQLRAEIGDAACDTTAQCKTIAVGHKACGGPETYLAWSSKRSDPAKVARLAEAYGSKRKADNLASGMVSNCAMAIDPGATCNAGRCVPGGGNAAI